jgi:hypothetical protein
LIGSSFSFFGFLFVSIYTLTFSAIISSFIQVSIVSLFPIITFSFVEDYSISSFHKSISRAKTQDFQANSSNRQFPNFSQTKNKEKKIIHKGLEFRKNIYKQWG